MSESNVARNYSERIPEEHARHESHLEKGQENALTFYSENGVLFSIGCLTFLHFSHIHCTKVESGARFLSRGSREVL